VIYLIGAGQTVWRSKRVILLDGWAEPKGPFPLGVSLLRLWLDQAVQRFDESSCALKASRASHAATERTLRRVGISMVGRVRTMRFGDAEPVSRSGFLRRAGVAGLALAGIGDLVAAPLASAKMSSRAVRSSGQLRMYDNLGDLPNSCRSYSKCSPCSGCCGQPCQPPGVGYCFYCSATPCQGAGVACYDHSPNTFYICCNQ
jgi:hypothetical protein